MKNILKNKNRKMLKKPFVKLTATPENIEESMRFIIKNIKVCKNPERKKKYKLILLHLEKERKLLIKKIAEKNEDEELFQKLLSKYSI